VRPNGRWWVLGLLALGTGLGLSAVFYWLRPENAVRGAFSGFHTSLLRGRKDKAGKILAPELVYQGRLMSDREFLTLYAPPPEPGEVAAAPCPSQAGHWTVAMHGEAFCFRPAGRGWKLHSVVVAPCPCR
jgi:hypothetical protein